MMAGPLVPILAAAAALAGCSQERAAEAPREMRMEGMMGRGMPAMERMPDWMISDERMMDAGMMHDMRTIHGLLGNPGKIDRQVEDLPNGVRTVTTSDDPAIARLIRTHVRQMEARYARGQTIRMMDPVFRELFRHRDKASLVYQDIPGGLRVTHTSDDPQVVLLIRQHARRFVSEAAEQGMRRAMHGTPLPEGYRAGAE